jgi:hypothetical protein
VELLPRATHLSALDGALLASRAAFDAYVLPPQYLRLQLQLGFLVVSNSPDDPRQHYKWHVGNHGEQYGGRFVAAHHIGLALHNQRDPLVYVSTLAPDTRDTTPVVLGVRPERLAASLVLRNTPQAPLDDLLDPRLLLPNAAAPIAPDSAMPSAA